MKRGLASTIPPANDYDSAIVQSLSPGAYTAVLGGKGGTTGVALVEIYDLDLTVDGADELDNDLRLIKGGGGALLREKIVASASQRMIVIADGSKLVTKLGRFPLPIEVMPFGLTATERAIARLLDSLSMTGELRLRRAADGAPYVTDGGHFILDAHLERIDKPNVLASTLNNIAGVVEHGLFLGLATGAILATADGLVELGQL